MAARRPRVAPAAKAPARVFKRCAVCGRLRSYEQDDRYCVVCGHEPLDDSCACGRAYDYLGDDEAALHCPRCGTTLNGRKREYEE